MNTLAVATGEQGLEFFAFDASYEKNFEREMRI